MQGNTVFTSLSQIMQNISLDTQNSEPACRKTTNTASMDFRGSGLAIESESSGFIPSITVGHDANVKSLKDRITTNAYHPEEFSIIDFLEEISSMTRVKTIDLPKSKHNGISVGDYRDKEIFIDTHKHKKAYYRCPEASKPELCVHGTNLYSALLALKLAGGNLIPSNKQKKIFGPPMTGESYGETPLNQKYVSTVSLNTLSSTFSDAIMYAEGAIYRFRKSIEFNSIILMGKASPALLNTYVRLSKIPCVIIGTGTGLTGVYSEIKNEVGFKRVKILTLAVPDDDCKKEVMESLTKLTKNNEINVVLISDLKYRNSLRTKEYEELNLEGLVPASLLES